MIPQNFGKNWCEAVWFFCFFQKSRIFAFYFQIIKIMATALQRQVLITVPMGDWDVFTKLAKQFKWATTTEDIQVLTPNKTTQKAIDEAYSGKKLKRYTSVDKLLADCLN